MHKNRILLVGCSHSASSGFTDENFEKYHFSKLLERKYDINIYNKALAGASNSIIFNQTVMTTTAQDFDGVIVQWSALHRLWMYNSSDSENGEEWTTILQFQPLTGDYLTFQKIYIDKFINVYESIKQRLIKIIA